MDDNSVKQSRYLDFLPTFFQENRLLGSFLLPFEKKMDELSAIVDRMSSVFDPYLTEEEFLPWLASWVSLVLDSEWDEAKRRELIARAVDLYKHRGTVRGLKEYLAIYTGLEPEIREWCWPGGMQIGVASMMGGLYPRQPFPDDISAHPVIEELSPLTRIRRYEPEYFDYYVIERLDGTEPAFVMIKVDSPGAVRVELDYENKGLVNELSVVTVTDSDGAVTVYKNATVSRWDRVVHDVYPLESGRGFSAEYRGDTFLIDELSGDDILPWRFTVDVKVPPDQRDHVKIDKVKAIVDLEKPAHTQYYLKLSLVESKTAFEHMQIEVRSDVGINTVIG